MRGLASTTLQGGSCSARGGQIPLTREIARPPQAKHGASPRTRVVAFGFLFPSDSRRSPEIGRARASPRTRVVAPRCLACGGPMSSLVGGESPPLAEHQPQVAIDSFFSDRARPGAVNSPRRERSLPRRRPSTAPPVELAPGNWRSHSIRCQACNTRSGLAPSDTRQRAISFARRSAATPSRAKRSEHRQYAASGSRLVCEAHRPRSCRPCQ